MSKLKHILCIALSLTILVGHTSCGNNDEDDNGLGYYQTNEDKKLEKELMNTKWKLSKWVVYDNDDQIVEEYPDDGPVYHLTSKKDTTVYNPHYYVCIETLEDGRIRIDNWSVQNNKAVLISHHLGKLISYTENELIISDHKQDVFGDGDDYIEQDGYTCYFTKIVD